MIGKRVMSALSSLGGKVAGAREDLDRLRAEIARMRSELDLERSRPVPFAEAEARIAALVAHWAREAESAVPAGWFVAAEPPTAGDFIGTNLTPLTMVAATAPATLKAWLLAREAEALTRLPEPVDAVTRAARIVKLESEIAAAERSEADMLWSAMDSGVDLPWRADADPAAVLGLEAAA